MKVYALDEYYMGMDLSTERYDDLLDISARRGGNFNNTCNLVARVKHRLLTSKDNGSLHNDIS